MSICSLCAKSHRNPFNGFDNYISLWQTDTTLGTAYITLWCLSAAYWSHNNNVNISKQQQACCFYKRCTAPHGYNSLYSFTSIFHCLPMSFRSDTIIVQYFTRPLDFYISTKTEFSNTKRTSYTTNTTRTSLPHSNLGKAHRSLTIT